jgi:hypothetical protein
MFVGYEVVHLADRAVVTTPYPILIPFFPRGCAGRILNTPQRKPARVRTKCARLGPPNAQSKINLCEVVVR